MNPQSIIIGVLVAISYIKIVQGLQCYEHDYCFVNCPELSKHIAQCTHEKSKCWKVTSPLGTKRGCGNNRCKLQVDVTLIETANLCCSNDLCNSSNQIKITTIAIVLTILIAFMYT